MAKSHPVSIGSETHALAGTLMLPEGAAASTPVPGAVIVGGPGPLPMQRYTSTGTKQWPVLWSESLAKAGFAALCYDQRGAGLSTGVYHEADWNALYDDARAATEMLAVQPEVSRVVAIAFDAGCAFGLQLAAEGKVNALVLMAPAYRTEEERYVRAISALAAKKGLSDRVVQIRVNQWRDDLLATVRRVEQGETTSTVDLSGQAVVTNLVRFLQTVAFDPASVVSQVKVPVLLLHGLEDRVILPEESAAMAEALGPQSRRLTYPGKGHFLQNEVRPLADTTRWLTETLG
ncbi:MAG: alpha/beta hydrolase [Mycobacterium leprae]